MVFLVFVSEAGAAFFGAGAALRRDFDRFRRLTPELPEVAAGDLGPSPSEVDSSVCE